MRNIVRQLIIYYKDSGVQSVTEALHTILNHIKKLYINLICKGQKLVWTVIFSTHNLSFLSFFTVAKLGIYIWGGHV